MNKKRLFIFIGVVIGSLIFLLSFWKTRDYLLQTLYDLNHSNPDLYSSKSIDSLLANLEMVAFKDLEKSYLDFTKSNEVPYRNLLQSKRYYKVRRRDLYRKVVGPIRVKHLLCKDRYYRDCLYDKNAYQYWLIDKKLLYRLLALKTLLKKEGYDPNGFDVISGYRHPLHNEQVGGARSSKHIKGEAVDLLIRDINQDGRYKDADKAIILQLVDQKIIGDRGGVGRYPGSRVIHIDVRGHRARWDSY